MIKVVYYILWMLALLHASYFVITALFTFKKGKSLKGGDGKTKFGIILPARNEEKVIGDLIESLNKQRYAKNLYDVMVFVNNCTDSTREVAKKAGAKVIEVTKNVSSKGEVLTFAIESLKDSDYQAYIIFDADNVVDPDFLNVMDDVYFSGFKAAQAQRETKNVNDGWISSCYSLFYYIQNLFFNRSRIRLNASCSINGTGFMIDKKFAEEKYKPKTLTEDIELSIFCNLEGEKIFYAEDAITYDEHPTKFNVSWKQRTRWSVGIMQCVRAYSWTLLKNALKKRDFSCFDKLLFILTPFLQVLSFALGVFAFVAGLFGVSVGVFGDLPLWSYWVWTIIIYLIMMIFYALVFLYHKKSITKNFMGILLFDFFIFTWVFINIYSIPKKTLEWKPIVHEKSMKKV